jgi:glycosyltransferase involved in cell wall biosynthesis
LSSLEAAFYNCNLVITDKGDTVEYFGKNAWYCDPGNPDSIYEAILLASEAAPNTTLREKIINTYNWNQAAIQTLAVYKAYLSK